MTTIKEYKAIMGWKPIKTLPENSEMVLVELPRIMNLVVRSWYDVHHKCWKSDRDTDGGITNVEFYHEGDLWHSVPPAHNLTDELIRVIELAESELMAIHLQYGDEENAYKHSEALSEIRKLKGDA